MIFLFIAVAAVAIFLCAYLYWSSQVFPTPRLFRYNTNSDIHLTESRVTSLHQVFDSKYQVNKMVQAELTDAERVDTLFKWVSSLWSPKSKRASKSINPLAIANRALAGEKFQPQDYNLLLAHSLMTVGIPCRLLTLSARDNAWRLKNIEYEGLEYFDKDLQKWVWYDGQKGIRISQSQIPVSALELKEAIINKYILIANDASDDVNLDAYLLKLKPYMDLFIACPLGQNRRFALVPPQLNPARKKFLVGRKLFEASCYSTASFYSTHSTQPFYAGSRVTKTEVPLKAVANG